MSVHDKNIPINGCASWKISILLLNANKMTQPRSTCRRLATTLSRVGGYTLTCMCMRAVLQYMYVALHDTPDCMQYAHATKTHAIYIGHRVMSLCAGGLAMCPSSEYSGLWSAKTSQFVQHFRQHRMYEGHDVDCACSDSRFIDFYTGVPGFRINYIIL